MQARIKVLSLTIVFLLVFFNTYSQKTSIVNKKVMEYTKKMIGKKVDRGECWDLVAKALDFAQAAWTRPKGFGKVLNLEKDNVKEGDIISFNNVKFELPNSWMTFPKHYAVIYKVYSFGDYQIAHQNFKNIKKVSLLDINLSYRTKGKITIFRPHK